MDVFEPGAFDARADRWHARLSAQATDAGAIADAMDRVNPVYIARNHRVEEALTAATAGDLRPFRRLLEVLAHAVRRTNRTGSFASPAPSTFGEYRTFCGT